MEASERKWDEIVLGTTAEITKHTMDWRISRGFETGWFNFAEKLMLIVTELDEVREARINAEDALSCLLGHESNLDMQLQSLQRLSVILANYHEEWADTMVRIFDLCGACGLLIEVSDYPGSQPGLEATLESHGMARIEECMHCLSAAMESFRHVKLREIPDGETSQLLPEAGVPLNDLVEWIGGAASVASWAMADLGERWQRHYMMAMEKNEKRPYKHGKQR